MQQENSNIKNENTPVFNIKHRAFYFSKAMIEFISNAKYDKVFFSMFDQVLRSGTSIGANLVEGSAGVSEKDFLKYYGISLKSANETKYWLSLIKFLKNADVAKIESLIIEANELSKIIASIILNLKKRINETKNQATKK